MYNFFQGGQNKVYRLMFSLKLYIILNILINS